MMPQQLAFELAPPALPTLENFVVGRNAELVARLSVLPNAAERAFYIWGAPASGRTHLLRAALARIERSRLTTAYVAAGAALDAATAADAVAVDEVHLLDAQRQAALFTLCNVLRERGGILLAAGDAPPSELRLRADVVTRLAWGLVYEVHALTDAEKAQALAEHAAARGFSLPPEVSRYLLAHVPRDMRTLVAAVDALDRYAMQVKRPVTVPLLRELLGQ